MALWELMGKLVFIMGSRFHRNDTNAIVVIPEKAGIHPTKHTDSHGKKYKIIEQFPESSILNYMKVK